jgi:hypothetical protein
VPYTGSPDTPIDEVRFLVGDINPDRPLLSDGEVFYALEKKGQVVKAAAAMVARQIASSLPLRFTGYQLADYKDPNGAAMAKEYRAIAARLEGEIIAGMGAIGAGGVYAGGISVTDKESVASNTDRVEPVFTIGMMDSPG